MSRGSDSKVERVRILDLAGGMEDAVFKAVAVLRGGGLVIYPTESCYALGADALNPEAVRKVYVAKKRPFSLPLPVIVADEWMWGRYVEFMPEALTLIRRFSPGPLTIVLKKKLIVPDVLNPSALAARISSHPVASRLVSRFGSPVVSTSANVHGGKEPYDVREALNSLASFEGIALDGRRLPRRLVSTIVDLTVRPYRVQRAFPEGAIKADTIRYLLEGGS